MQHMDQGLQALPGDSPIGKCSLHACSEQSRCSEKALHLEAEVVGQDAALGEALVALADHALCPRVHAVMSVAKLGRCGMGKGQGACNQEGTLLAMCLVNACARMRSGSCNCFG